MLTGEIRANATANSVVKSKADISNHNVDNSGSVFGSLTMWNVPRDAPISQWESAFNNVDFIKVLRD
ncbi:hypothetical protein JG687_00016200 [Phytophthora cactorum]|uniref:Uncharacterized protein n=1 Tax=Phytophthora cactorum TaxID=29920 RepID=A0A8T1TTX2_9STRA|nr:hypothetical protein JG687_00016200 [Phytophthora cactorum]